MSVGTPDGTEGWRRAAEEASRRAGTKVHHRDDALFRGEIAAARFGLDNGLTILVLADPRAPIFTYQTWFRVGSRHEEPHRTGLAHLFEHLMFKGTESAPPGLFDREMEERGAQTNAATWVDWTYYTETLAARDDNLETVVRFEADRMRHLVLDDETFATELEVVKNERRMSVDDSIPGLLHERLHALAFERHPYRWPTIGSIEHLEAATLDDLRRFYETFYAPNNATIVVAGGMDVPDALTTIARAYGPLEPRPLPARPAIVEPPQDEPRQLVLKRPATTTQIAVGYRAAALTDPDFGALEMIADILGAGESARLYRGLVVDAELCVDVEAWVPPFADPGLFQIALTLRPGVEAAPVLDRLQKLLDDLPERIEPFEREKARNSLELATFDALRETESEAELLGHYETVTGDYRRGFAALDRWRRVGDEDLERVARTSLTASRRSAVVLLPEGGPS